MGMVACFASVTAEDLQRLQADPSRLEDYLHSEQPEPPHLTDLDKAWHAIHYMLCEGAMDADGPAAQAVLGGEALGEDWGYGPARYLTPQQVVPIARLLEALPPEKFAARYAPEAMDRADVYPTIWVRDGAEGLEYILEFYQQLRVFYRDVAAEGRGAFLWLS